VTATGGAPPVIRVDDVRKSYGDVRAVDGVSFAVTQGEVFGLLGPNGAGKTTTVEMLEGLRAPDSGNLEVLGIDAARDPAALKERIGVTLQTAALYPKLTVVEILDLFRSFYRRSIPTEQLIGDLDLGERRKAQTRELSGGQRQRLSIALALVNDPEVVFLDEPTTGLDPAARRSLWDLIVGLKSQGKTVLLTTHYLEEADQLAERLAIVDRGKVVAEGTPEALKRELRGDAIHVDLEADYNGTVSRALADLAAVRDVNVEGRTLRARADDGGRAVPLVLQALEIHGVGVSSVRVARPSLDDVYLKYTGRTFDAADAEAEVTR